MATEIRKSLLGVFWVTGSKNQSLIVQNLPNTIKLAKNMFYDPQIFKNQFLRHDSMCVYQNFLCKLEIKNFFIEKYNTTLFFSFNIYLIFYLEVLLLRNLLLLDFPDRIPKFENFLSLNRTYPSSTAIVKEPPESP